MYGKNYLQSVSQWSSVTWAVEHVKLQIGLEVEQFVSVWFKRFDGLVLPIDFILFFNLTIFSF